MQDIIKEAYEYGNKYIEEGKLADYIPELSRENKNISSISLIDDKGTIYNIGDYKHKFSIQSIVKTILYLIVLEEYGFEESLKYVGAQPSAKSFNSIVELETSNNKVPINPFVNAGAISSTCLIYKKFGEKTFEKILSRASELMEEDLSYSESIYQSERSTAYRNVALAYLMLSNKVFPDQALVDKVLDAYFMACSILVSSENLAKFSFILSNKGLDLKGQRHIDEKHARIIRTLMSLCGLYDSSGVFAVKVGLPAKSGVGGGILTTTNKNFGLAVHSPGLDSHGNSLVGIKFLEYISEKLDLYVY